VGNPNRTAAFHLRTGEIVVVSETSAFDVFGRRYVAARRNGEIGLYEFGKGVVATVSLGGDR